MRWPSLTWTNENQLNGHWGPHMVGLQCWLQFLQLLWFQGHWVVTISDILPIFPQADLINIYPDTHWHSVRSAFPFAVNTPTSMLQLQLKFGMSQDWNHIFSKACSPLLSPYVPSSSRGYPNYKHGHQPFIFYSGSPALSKLASRVFGILPPVFVIRRPHRQHLDQKESLVVPLPQHSCHNVF